VVDRFQQRDLASSALVGVPDETLLGYEHRPRDSVHRTTPSTFEPDGFESAGGGCTIGHTIAPVRMLV
jgi:hypothetical protein